MRAGVCHLIHSIATAGIGLDDNLQHRLFKTMTENFKHPNNEIQDEAIRAFNTYCNVYFPDSQSAEELKLNDQHPIIVDVKKLFKPSKDDLNIATTRGYNAAFGALSKQLLKYFYPGIVDTLMVNCIPKGTEADDAESRKQSMRALIKVVQTLTIQEIT